MGFKPIFEKERLFFKENTGFDLPTECWRDGSKIYLDITCKKPLYTFRVVEGKINIVKDNTSLFTDYKQKSVKELINENQTRLDELYQESLDFLIKYIKDNPSKTWIVSHSGGKDSTVTYLVWQHALRTLKEEGIDVDYRISFANTSNETGDTYKYIKQLPKDKLDILNPKEGFYQWIKRKEYFIPSVLVRNCCSTYKEGQINKVYDKNEEIVMILGLRKYESVKRAKYDWIMDYEFSEKLFNSRVNMSKHWVKLAPIIEWRDEDVWMFIIANDVKVNRQYELGFNRCGCLICPYQSNYIDLLTAKHYPRLWERWVNDILPKNYENTYVFDRFKWSLKEWQDGKWKTGVSKVYEITRNKANPERVKAVADLLNISEDIAQKYFERKCYKCDRKLNPTDAAMNLKLFGREVSPDKVMCRKHICEEFNLNSKEYNAKIIEFREGGCNLF